MGDEVCLGLRLVLPFWCSFRDPASSNVHRTFPVPPPATLYGLVGAALGLGQHDYSRRDDMRFAVAIESHGETVESYSKWMKIAEGAKDAKQTAAWQAMRERGLLAPDECQWLSTTLIRQKIIQPTFVVGVLCSEAVAVEIRNAFTRPFFPLCLGESDYPVDVEVLGTEAPAPAQGHATGLVDGVCAGGVLVSVPTRFTQGRRGKWQVERWLVTVPDATAGTLINAPNLVSCHGQTWHFEPKPAML
jgi:CRISPR-associated Cas5-like protein